MQCSRSNPVLQGKHLPTEVQRQGGLWCSLMLFCGIFHTSMYHRELWVQHNLSVGRKGLFDKIEQGKVEGWFESVWSLYQSMVRSLSRLPWFVVGADFHDQSIQTTSEAQMPGHCQLMYRVSVKLSAAFCACMCCPCLLPKNTAKIK